MARTARKIAQSGVYHVSFRPCANRAVFCTDADAQQFLAILSAEKERDAFEIFTYCLLPHTAHLVVREGLSGITANLMRVVRAYANYCNDAQKQTGKLMHGRFYSAPLETPDIILDATRFVHRLPLLHGLPLSYEHSGYRSFFKHSDLLSNKEILSLLPSAIDYRLYCDEPCDHKFKP